MSDKKKSMVSPEQVEKACDAMGKAANSVDNFYDNVKFKLGPVGAAFGFGVLATLVFALISHPGLVFVLVLMVAVGSAPMIRKKLLEVKLEAEKLKKKDPVQEPTEQKVDEKKE